MWDQWLDSKGTVHRLSDGSSKPTQVPTVTWSQGLLAPNPKVVEPRPCHPSHPHPCCCLMTGRMHSHAPVEKNFLLNSGDKPISSFVLIFHLHSGLGPHQLFSKNSTDFYVNFSLLT